ncbi:MAG: hypothetical protein IAG10_04705 [Planctomycetaceae bacterium]|nr:hypothetical protein [Planctomycetaceae bacterium]
MTDKHITVDSIRWYSVLPCLHLLRVPQLAFRVRTISVAMLAVLVFALGNASLRNLPFVAWKDSESLFPILSDLSAAVSGHSFSYSDDRDKSNKEKKRWLKPRDELPERRYRTWVGYYGWMTWPLETVIQPARRLFDFGNRWSEVATAWTALLWALLIWGVFGGALSRMMAVRFARDESVPLRAALRFSIRNWQSYLYGPLLPLLGVGFFTLIAFSVGSLERWLIASNGMVLAVFGFVPVLCAVAMTFLLWLTAVGWPLMTVATSTEGSDGFDGLSRAFGYVLNRFWYLLGLTLLVVIIGYFASGLLILFFETAFWLVDWSVGPTSENDSGSLWFDVLNIVRLGVSVSFFWSATTVIYFLLRQSDDGTPLDQVYIPGPPPKAEPLPLVGVAASQQPVIERPTVEPVTTSGSPVVPENS